MLLLRRQIDHRQVDFSVDGISFVSGLFAEAGFGIIVGCVEDVLDLIPSVAGAGWLGLVGGAVCIGGGVGGAEEEG